MLKRLLSLLILLPGLLLAQAPKVQVTTRAITGAPLSFTQADKNFTDLQAAANASQRAWGPKDSTTSGLVFGYYGGAAFNGTTWVSIADGTVTLAASATNYVERTAAGVVSANTTGWTAGRTPMAVVVTGATTITSTVDHRGGLGLAALADAASPSLGAGLTGYNSALSYAAGSVGYTLKSQNTRPGNRIAVIGDSTSRGVYGSYDSEPGVGGTTAYIAGDSWITWASTLSGGKIVRAVNGGVIGDTIAMMNARVTADIISHPTNPKVCIVYSGYNDAYSGVSPSAFINTYDSLVSKLKAAGITPIAATCLPTMNNATIAGLLISYSLKIRKYAADNGLILLDFEAWAMDPATGGLTSAVGSGGDGVHPGSAGQKFLGQKVVDALTPYLSPSSSSLQISPLDASNITPNGLFLGTPVSGLAPNVFNFSGQANTVDSVVTDALVPGSMQRCTHTGSSGVRIFAMRIPQAGRWAPGDVLELTGIVTCSGITAEVEIDFNCPPYAQKAISITSPVTRGYYCARIPIPTAIAVNFIDIKMNSGPGTGTADFGQLTVRNLTALGLL